MIYRFLRLVSLSSLIPICSALCASEQRTALKDQPFPTAIAQEAWLPSRTQELPIPADGNCLYNAILVDYLLPVVEDEQLFTLRLHHLVGEDQVAKTKKQKEESKRDNENDDEKEENDLWKPSLVRNAFEQLRYRSTFVAALRGDRFAGLITDMKKHLGIRRTAQWGGAQEVERIANHLQLSIEEYTPDPDNPENLTEPLRINPRKKKPLLTLRIVRDNPTQEESVDPAQDWNMQIAQQRSSQDAQHRQHYRALLDATSIASLYSSQHQTAQGVSFSYPSTSDIFIDDSSSPSYVPYSLPSSEETFSETNGKERYTREFQDTLNPLGQFDFSAHFYDLLKKLETAPYSTEEYDLLLKHLIDFQEESQSPLTVLEDMMEILGQLPSALDTLIDSPQDELPHALYHEALRESLLDKDCFEFDEIDKMIAQSHTLLPQTIDASQSWFYTTFATALAKEKNLHHLQTLTHLFTNYHIRLSDFYMVIKTLNKEKKYHSLPLYIRCILSQSVFWFQKMNKYEDALLRKKTFSLIFSWPSLKEALSFFKPLLVTKKNKLQQCSSSKEGKRFFPLLIEAALYGIPDVIVHQQIQECLIGKNRLNYYELFAPWIFAMGERFSREEIVERATQLQQINEVLQEFEKKQHLKKKNVINSYKPYRPSIIGKQKNLSGIEYILAQLKQIKEWLIGKSRLDYYKLYAPWIFGRQKRLSQKEIIERVAQSTHQNKIKEFQSQEQLKKRIEAVDRALQISLKGKKKPIKEWSKEKIRKWTREREEKRFSRTFLLAVVEQAVYRTYGFYPRTVQRIACLKALYKKTKSEHEPKKPLNDPQENHLTPYTEKQEKGILIQKNTGEGKSLIIAMIAIVIALQEDYVDIAVSSSELSKREVAEMKELYAIFGLNAAENSPQDKDQIDLKICYRASILYGMVSDLQADILQAEFAGAKKIRNNRPFRTIIVDEVDNMLLDGCGHATRIASKSPGTNTLLPILATIWSRLQEIQCGIKEWKGKLCYAPLAYIEQDVIHLPPGSKIEEVVEPIDNRIDYTTRQLTKYVENLLEEFDINYEEQKKIVAYQNYAYEKYILEEERKYCPQTEKKRVEEIEVLLKSCNDKIEALEKNGPLSKSIDYLPKYLRKYVQKHYPKWIDNAIAAYFYYEKEKDYLIVEGKIVPVDYDNTGLLEHGVVWSRGLNQFLCIKHDLELAPENIVTNYLSNITLFRRYQRIIGLTGTLGDAPSQEFFKETYHVACLIIPPHKETIIPDTDKQGFLCKELPPVLVVKEHPKAVLESNLLHLTRGRACLIIIRYIEELEVLAKLFAQEAPDIKVYVYNGKDPFDHFCLQPKELVLATFIAGRGANFTTSPAVEEHGGLHVCITCYPKNIRVCKQNAGRTARAGRKGTFQLVIQSRASSLEEIRAPDEAEKRMQNEIETARTILFKDSLFQRFCTFLNWVLAPNPGVITLVRKISRNWKRFRKRTQEDFKKEDDDEKDMPSSENYLRSFLNKRTSWSNAIRQGISERWGLWLAETSFDIPAHQRKEKEQEINSSFEKLLKDIEKCIQPESRRCIHPEDEEHPKVFNLFDNPYYYIQEGNFSLEYSKYNIAIYYYNIAIDKDPLLACYAWYNKAYALLKRGEKKKKVIYYIPEAEKALLKAGALVHCYHIPCLNNLEVILNSYGSKHNIKQQLERQHRIFYKLAFEIKKSLLFLRKKRAQKKEVCADSWNILQSFFREKQKNEKGKEISQPCCKKEVQSATQHGLTHLFSIELLIPIPKKKLAVVSVLGGGQLILGAGIMIATKSTSSRISQVLVQEGLSDLVHVFRNRKNRNFKLKNYATQKAISIAIQGGAYGVGKYLQGGKNFKKTLQLVGDDAGAAKSSLKQTAQFFTPSKKAINKMLKEGINTVLKSQLKLVGKEIGKQTLHYFAQEVTRTLFDSISTYLLGCAATYMFEKRLTQFFVTELRNSLILQQLYALDFLEGNEEREWEFLIMEESSQVIERQPKTFGDHVYRKIREACDKDEEYLLEDQKNSNMHKAGQVFHGVSRQAAREKIRQSTHALRQKAYTILHNISSQKTDKAISDLRGTASEQANKAMDMESSSFLEAYKISLKDGFTTENVLAGTACVSKVAEVGQAMWNIHHARKQTTRTLNIVLEKKYRKNVDREKHRIPQNLFAFNHQQASFFTAQDEPVLAPPPSSKEEKEEQEDEKEDPDQDEEDDLTLRSELDWQKKDPTAQYRLIKTQKLAFHLAKIILHRSVQETHMALLKPISDHLASEGIKRIPKELHKRFILPKEVEAYFEDKEHYKPTTVPREEQEKLLLSGQVTLRKGKNGQIVFEVHLEQGVPPITCFSFDEVAAKLHFSQYARQGDHYQEKVDIIAQKLEEATEGMPPEELTSYMKKQLGKAQQKQAKYTETSTIYTPYIEESLAELEGTGKFLEKKLAETAKKEKAFDQYNELRQIKGQVVPFVSQAKKNHLYLYTQAMLQKHSGQMSQKMEDLSKKKELTEMEKAELDNYRRLLQKTQNHLKASQPALYKNTPIRGDPQKREQLDLYHATLQKNEKSLSQARLILDIPQATDFSNTPDIYKAQLEAYKKAGRIIEEKDEKGKVIGYRVLFFNEQGKQQGVQYTQFPLEALNSVLEGDPHQWAEVVKRQQEFYEKDLNKQLRGKNEAQKIEVIQKEFKKLKEERKALPKDHYSIEHREKNSQFKVLQKALSDVAEKNQEQINKTSFLYRTNEQDKKIYEEAKEKKAKIQALKPEVNTQLRQTDSTYYKGYLIPNYIYGSHEALNKKVEDFCKAHEESPLRSKREMQEALVLLQTLQTLEKIEEREVEYTAGIAAAADPEYDGDQIASDRYTQTQTSLTKLQEHLGRESESFEVSWGETGTALKEGAKEWGHDVEFLIKAGQFIYEASEGTNPFFSLLTTTIETGKKLCGDINKGDVQSYKDYALFFLGSFQDKAATIPRKIKAGLETIKEGYISYQENARVAHNDPDHALKQEAYSVATAIQKEKEARIRMFDTATYRNLKKEERLQTIKNRGWWMAEAASWIGTEIITFGLCNLAQAAKLRRALHILKEVNLSAEAGKEFAQIARMTNAAQKNRALTKFFAQHQHITAQLLEKASLMRVLEGAHYTTQGKRVIENVEKLERTIFKQFVRSVEKMEHAQKAAAHVKDSFKFSKKFLREAQFSKEILEYAGASERGLREFATIQQIKNAAERVRKLEGFLKCRPKVARNLYELKETGRLNKAAQILSRRGTQQVLKQARSGKALTTSQKVLRTAGATGKGVQRFAEIQKIVNAEERFQKLATFFRQRPKVCEALQKNNRLKKLLHASGFKNEDSLKKLLKLVKEGGRKWRRDTAYGLLKSCQASRPQIEALAKIASIPDNTKRVEQLTAFLQAGKNKELVKALSSCKEGTALLKEIEATATILAIGQEHHAFSQRIWRAIQKHKELSKHFKNRNDPRFLVRARDLPAHQGYQKWHIAYDKRVAGWIEKAKVEKGIEGEFIKFLHDLYTIKELRISQTEFVKLADKFPNVDFLSKFGL